MPLVIDTSPVVPLVSLLVDKLYNPSLSLVIAKSTSGPTGDPIGGSSCRCKILCHFYFNWAKFELVLDSFFNHRFLLLISSKGDHYLKDLKIYGLYKNSWSPLLIYLVYLSMKFLKNSWKSHHPIFFKSKIFTSTRSSLRLYQLISEHGREEIFYVKLIEEKAHITVRILCYV